MTYCNFSAGSKDYKLRLNTRNIVELEKKLGYNPALIYGINGDRIPTVNEMVTILHASLQSFHHGIKLDDAFNIFDEYLADGKSVMEFGFVINEIYQVSGILPKSIDSEEGEGEKNQ